MDKKIWVVILLEFVLIGFLLYTLVQRSIAPIDDLEKHFCTEEQRNVDACIEIYQPVCGWSDPAKIQCIRYPCASTYSNSCFACMDENVLYWTEGDCESITPP